MVFAHSHQTEPGPSYWSGVQRTYCSRTWRRGDAVEPDPLGVGLLHCGLLHVLPLGEDFFHRRHVVGAHG